MNTAASVGKFFPIATFCPSMTVLPAASVPHLVALDTDGPKARANEKTRKDGR